MIFHPIGEMQSDLGLANPTKSKQRKLLAIHELEKFVCYLPNDSISTCEILVSVKRNYVVHAAMI